jgi:CHAT domain-containing protein
MGALPETAQSLAETLAAADDPVAVLPSVLPCDPLDLLIALHEEVKRSMLKDLAYAGRAAAAAWLIARRSPDDPLLQAQVHWTQATAILYVPDYVRSLEHYDVALTWYDRACQALAPTIPARDIRVVHIVRIFCLSELGRYREAQEAVELAERWLHDHPNDAAHLTFIENRSVLAFSMGDYAKMIDLADAMIALATRLDYPDRIAHGWVNRAYACTYLGRFAEAEAALNQGIAAATLAEEPITIARAQLNRAYLLRCQGHLFAALQILQEAQHGLTQAEGEAAEVALVQAAIYEQLRQLPEAQQSARFAAERYAQQLMPTYSADAALQAARIAVQRHQESAARKLLRRATIQAEQAHLPVLTAKIQLTETLLATLPVQDVAPSALTRKRRIARTTAQQAVAVLQSLGFVQEATEGLLTVATLDVQLGDIEAALALYQSLAEQSYRQIQLTANTELGVLLPVAEALPYLQRAAALAVEQRRSLPMEELQARYSTETSSCHMRLAACYMALGDVVSAFETVCAAKAGSLLDLRAAAGSVDEATRALLESAKASIVQWRDQEREHRRTAQHAVQMGHHERAAYHLQRAQAAAAELHTSEQTLTAALRTLGDRVGHMRVPCLAEIQRALLPGMAVLEYAHWGDDLFSFLVQPHHPPAFRRLGEYHRLAPLLDRLYLIDDPQAPNARTEIQEALAPFRNILVAPWQAEIATAAHLLIAPCGMLHHVPWAALWDGTAYLSEQFTLTLTPCVALWAAPHDLPRVSIGPPRLLGCPGSEQQHLAHVAEELAAISRHIPDAQIIANATASDLRLTPAPWLLHVAAHGHTNPAAPVCSTLELADGPFLLLEAHRLQLQGTQLVTLSACETGVRPDYGDMALALAGAFLCAGARAVLASLWAVSDAATAMFMERFYAALMAGVPPAEALRQAQQHLRRAHPLDWAAFQLWSGAH